MSEIPSDLVYNIPELKLSGRLRGVIIDCLAGSGGYSGTTKEKKEQFFISNNPYKTNVRVQGVPGVYGPLPMGYYYMSPYEKKTAYG